MSEKKIRDFAKTSHEGLPKKVQTKEEAIREALLDRMLGKIKQLDEFSLPGTGMVMSPKTNKDTGVTAPMMQRKVLGMNVGSPEMVKTSKPSKFGPIRQYTPQQVDRYNAQPNRPSTIKPDSLTGVQSSVAKPSAKPTAPKPTPSVTPKPTPPETASAGMARGLKNVPFLGDVADIANRADRKINYRDAPPELRKQMGLKNSYEPEGEMVDEAKRTRQERRASNTKKKGYDAQGNPNPRVSKTQVIHDVDDNLADQRHPDAAKIDVLRKTGDTWKKVQSLTPSQFAHHKLRGPGESVKEQKDDPGDKYGFDQFKDTKLFKRTTKPNKPIVRLGDSPKRPASKSIVTARGPKPGKPNTPMDDTKGFVDDLRTRIGVRGLKRKDVHFTGGMSTGSGPEKKGEVVKKIVKSDSKKIIATDDHLQNVRHMAAAASEVAPKAKVKAYQAKPATKQSGKVKPGDIVPVRVGKEGDLNDPKIGIRQNINPPSSPKENQRRRKTARRGMGESYDDSGFRQHSSSITSSSNSSNTPSKTASLMSRLRKLELMSPPKKKKKKKK
jgi:hypothetical protein